MLDRRGRRHGGDAFDQQLNRCRASLDAVQASVLIADLGLVLRWGNAKAHETLGAISGEIEAVFGVGYQDLFGASIHRFHRDPGRVERILHQQGGFTLPHSAEFSFGAVTLQTNADRWLDERGNHLGYLVTYVDVSDLKAAEGRSANLRGQLAAAAAAVEQLKESITEIASNAADASTLADRAEADTQHLSRDVSELDARRAEIDVSVESILSVASQTKLLALNATIEAARAGEAGKGFAVVAGEVKDLASKTALVTADINERLNLITESIGRLSGALDNFGHQMSQINSYQAGIASAVEEQRATSADLASSITQAVGHA